MSTTAEKIKVMQAYEDGKRIQMRPNGRHWQDVDTNCIPTWNWLGCEYRIKPEPREWWVVTSEDGVSYGAFICKEGADARISNLSNRKLRVVKVREVIES